MITKGEKNMSIQFINGLINPINDKLIMAKKDCLRMQELSFTGVKHELTENNSRTIMYSLLPGLEDFQIIVQIDANGMKHTYIAKLFLIAEISEESLEELLKRINLANTKIKQGNAEDLKELLTLPEEIENNCLIMSKLSLRKETHKLDLMFLEFALGIKKLREIQLQYWNMRSMNNQNIR